MNTRTMQHPQATAPGSRRWMMMAFWLLLAASVAWMSSAQAHEGHDHGGAAAKELAASAGSAAQSARFVVASEEFEVVGVLMKDQLLIYLDEVKTNAPIKGAQISVSAVSISGAASETTAGVYRLPLASDLAAGAHALTLNIDTADSADLLVATLEVKPAAAGPLAAGAGTAALSGYGWRWAAGGSVLLGIVFALFWTRRRGRPAVLIGRGETK